MLLYCFLPWYTPHFYLLAITVYNDTKRTTLLGRCGPVAVATNTSFFCLLMRLHNSNLDTYYNTYDMYIKNNNNNKKQWDNSG